MVEFISSVPYQIENGKDGTFFADELLSHIGHISYYYAEDMFFEALSIVNFYLWIIRKQQRQFFWHNRPSVWLILRNILWITPWSWHL